MHFETVTGVKHTHLAMAAQISNDCSIMNPETFRFIRKFCATFRLSSDIEFTCYDLYPVYFKAYFHKMKTTYEKAILHYNFSAQEANQLSEELLQKISDDFSLNAAMLIVVCTKHIDGTKGQDLFKALPNFLRDNRVPCDPSNFLAIEFEIFGYLNFNVSGVCSLLKYSEFRIQMFDFQKKKIMFFSSRSWF